MALSIVPQARGSLLNASTFLPKLNGLLRALASGHTLGGAATGEVKMTEGYDLPAFVIVPFYTSQHLRYLLQSLRLACGRTHVLEVQGCPMCEFACGMLPKLFQTCTCKPPYIHRA